MISSRGVPLFAFALLTTACAGPTTVQSPPPTAAFSSPAPAPSPTKALPADLVHPWFRWTEAITSWDGIGTWILGIETPTTVRLGATGVEAAIRRSDVDTVEIVSMTAADGCVPGDTGSYDWALSSSNRKLTLEPRADDCEQRMADIGGHWIVSDCPAYPEDFCLGALDPGVHVANYFTPLVPSSAWEFDPGAMSYRVGQGWSNTYDSANEYTLEPLTGPRRGVYMWTDVTIVSESWPCTPEPWARGRATPAELAGYLADQATLDVSPPEAVEVGGLQGLRVDLAVRPEASLPCRGDGIPFAPFLAHVDGSGLQWGFAAGNMSRLYFMDLGDGRTLVIDVVGVGPEAAQQLAEGIGIVESIELRT
jgi:hypothetical protein